MNSVNQNILPNLLHLRYKPKKPNFKGCKPCPAFELFDWVIWLPDSLSACRFRRLVPRSVLCLANSKSLRILKELRHFLRGSIVVIAGADTNLSKVLPAVEVLLPHCSKIYYEAKDVEHLEIKSFCMGFNSFYLRRIEPETILDLTKSVSEPTWEKQGVLASWGGIFPALDKRLNDRRAAIKFIENSTWIQREQLTPADYWRRLAESKFLLAPAGNGIQSPKLAEAWLLRAIPIVTNTPCFQDLKNEGFPLLIIDNWDDLTPNLLREFEAENCNIDWDKVQFMLTLKYFQSHYLRLSRDHPE